MSNRILIDEIIDKLQQIQGLALVAEHRLARLNDPDGDTPLIGAAQHKVWSAFQELQRAEIALRKQLEETRKEG